MIAFVIFSILAVTGALLVLLTKNPLRGALALLINFLSIAALFLISGAPFIAFIQVIIYAGAIVILILFVIMLLRLKEIGEDLDLTPRGFFSILLTLSLSAGILYGIFKGISVSIKPEGEISIKELGNILLTKYLIPFEAISILLLVAIVAAFYLSKREV
jgi:NADH-quinone oxidoreductase subunit J